MACTQSLWAPGRGGIIRAIHYWWLVKADTTWPAIWGTVLTVLFAMRIWFAARASLAKRGGALGSPEGA